uniref:Uncharacterized protein n=1 Tax=Arundo donax TaxID=35708 RepID=A0A0A9C6G7_ARUDO
MHNFDTMLQFQGRHRSSHHFNNDNSTHTFESLKVFTPGRNSSASSRHCIQSQWWRYLSISRQRTPPASAPSPTSAPAAAGERPSPRVPPASAFMPPPPPAAIARHAQAGRSTSGGC